METQNVATGGIHRRPCSYSKGRLLTVRIPKRAEFRTRKIKVEVP